MQEYLRDGERLDDLQNGYHIIQGSQAFRYGIDAVLLSDFARVKKGETILDMGTGTGIIPLLLTARKKGTHITGLEIQPESAALARRNVALNQLTEQITITEGDIKEAVSLFGTASFDVAVSNPPYMIGQHGIANPDQRLAIARHEVLCTFEDIVSQAAGVLTQKGRFYLIHRPFRLAEIIATLKKYRMEPKRMQLVYPYIDKEPNLVLLEACKGGNPRLQVDKPLIVYEKPGVYTKEICEIYGDGRES